MVDPERMRQKQLVACVAILGWMVSTACTGSGAGEEQAGTVASAHTGSATVAADRAVAVQAGEGLALTLSAELTTDAASYLSGQSITVTWDGLPGNAHDWIVIAPQGSELATVTSWSYTGGAPAGTTVFAAGSSAGTYVTRAFLDDSYELAVESAPFTIGGDVTVTTDATAYGFSQNVVVSWTGLSGSSTDWIALAVDGAPVTTVARWLYTGGGTSGSLTIGSPTATGTFTARAFNADSYSMVGESAPFTAGAATSSVSTDQASYATDQDIAVSWTGLEGAPGDWVALAAMDSPLTEVARWAYAESAAAGSTTFTGGLPEGLYIARTFSNNTYNLISESAVFAVFAALP